MITLEPIGTFHADSKASGLRRASQRGFRDLGRMGISGHLAPDGPQTEALAGVICGLTDAAIVQNDILGPAAFKEKLAIVRAFGGRAKC